MFNNLTQKLNRQDPIQNETEDKLNRNNFVNYVVNIIDSAPVENNSFILSINGKWGEGKTSVKNLIMEKLRNPKYSQDILMEYSSLEFQNQKDLQKDFVGRILGIINKDKNKNKTVWNTIYFHFNKIILAVIVILILTFIIKNPKNFFNFSYIFTSISLFLFYIVRFLKSFFFKASLEKSLEIFQKILLKIEVFFKIIDFNEIKDSNTSSEKLKEYLEVNPNIKNNKIIIFLDVFDSLELSQINLLIKLININLILPKCVFVLFYDKNIVSKALTTDAYSGSEFLEKFVNVQLDLPLITEQTLFAFLQNELEEKYHINIEFSDRFKYVKNYFSSLNKIYSFLDTFNLNYRITVNNANGININCNKNDFLFLEIIRFFENNLYYNIRKNKVILTCFNKKLLLETNESTNYENLEKDREKKFNNLFNNLHVAENRQNLKDLTLNLFPQIKEYNQNETVILNTFKSVGSYYFFDFYFIYDLSENNVSNNNFNILSVHLLNHEHFVAKFKEIFHITKEENILLFSTNFLFKLNEKFKTLDNLNIQTAFPEENIAFIKNLVWLYIYSNNSITKKLIINILIKYLYNNARLLSKLLIAFDSLLSQKDYSKCFYLIELLLLVSNRVLNIIFDSKPLYLKQYKKLITRLIYKHVYSIQLEVYLLSIKKHSFLNELQKKYLCTVVRDYLSNNDINKLGKNKRLTKYFNSSSFFKLKNLLFTEHLDLLMFYLESLIVVKSFNDKKYYTINPIELYPLKVIEIINLFEGKEMDKNNLIFKLLVKLENFDKNLKNKNFTINIQILIKELYIPVN